MWEGLNRRHFMVRTAAGLAGAVMSSYGFPWGDLAYGQQLKGKPIKFNATARWDWTQGGWYVVSAIQERGIWKKYFPPGTEITYSAPIQGGIVTTELIAGKTMIGHVGDAPAIIATFKRDQADIRAISVLGSSPSGYH